MAYIVLVIPIALGSNVHILADLGFVCLRCCVMLYKLCGGPLLLFVLTLMRQRLTSVKTPWFLTQRYTSRLIRDTKFQHLSLSIVL